MSDRCRFLIYCIEVYKHYKDATGKQVLDLFDRYGVTDYIMDSYEALHTTGEQYLVADVDRFIANRKREMTESMP